MRITLKMTAVFILISTVLCAVITSCSKSGPSDGIPDQQDTAGTESTQAAEYRAPDADYEGTAVRVCSNLWESSPWHINKYIEVFSESENGDPINDAIYRRNKKTEEELNVLLELYPIKAQSSTTEITTPVLAGEDAFIFALPNGTSLPAIVNKGDMLYDLNSITALDLDASWWDQKSVEELKLSGVSYMATGDLCFYTLAAPVVIYCNRKIVEDNQLENPYEIVREGKWTIDRFFGMAQDAARDINGDGEMTKEDMFGLVCYDETNNMLYSGGIRITRHTAEGGIELVMNNERTADIVKKMTEFVKNKSICMFASNYTGYTNVFFELLMATFSDNRALFFSQQLLVALDLRDMKADFGVLPYPKYNEEQTGYYSSGNSSWQTFVIVPVTVKDAEMCGNILSSMGYHAQQMVRPAFVDITTYNKVMRDDDSKEMLNIIFDNMVFDIAFYYNWGSIYSSVLEMIREGRDFSSQYAKSESKVRKEIENTLALLQNKTGS